MSRQEFNKWIPVKNSLYLLSVFDTVNKGAIDEDPIKQSQIPRISSTSFRCPEGMSYKQFTSIFMNSCMFH